MADDDIIGRPGGLARAKKLSPARRKEIAANAANARWRMPQKDRNARKKAKKK